MEESGSDRIIQHDGTVKKVDANSVTVSITSNPACSGCHAESICGISGKVEKIIEVKGKYNVSPGQPVIVEMEQSKGYKAVILSYILPLIILISCLAALISLSFNELTAGLISIASLLPYFIVLYLFRKRINRSFTFRLKT